MIERQQQLLDDCPEYLMVKQAVIILSLSGQTIEGLEITEQGVAKSDVINRIDGAV